MSSQKTIKVPAVGDAVTVLTSYDATTCIHVGKVVSVTPTGRQIYISYIWTNIHSTESHEVYTDATCVGLAGAWQAGQYPVFLGDLSGESLDALKARLATVKMKMGAHVHGIGTLIHHGIADLYPIQVKAMRDALTAAGITFEISPYWTLCVAPQANVKSALKKAGL